MSSVPPIVNQPREGENRRSVPRQKIGSLAYLDLGVNNGGFMIDVSEGGIRFQVAQPVMAGRIFRIKFKLPNTQQAIDTSVHVAWVDSSGKYGGLQFLDLGGSPKLRIQEWLAAQIAGDIQARLEEYAGRLEEAKETREPQSQLAPVSQAENPHLRGARESLLNQARSNAEDRIARAVPAVLAAAEDSKKVSELAEQTFQPAPADKRVPRSVLLKTVGAFGLVAVVIALLLQLSRSRSANRDLPAPKSAAGSTLGLKLERSGTDWRVGWNRDADVLLQAVGGHLSITDGSLRTELDLDPVELRSGSVMYAPHTGDVLVRLQVVGGNLAQPVNESVRVIGSMAASTQTPASRSSSNDSAGSRSSRSPANESVASSKKSADEPSSVSSKSSAPLSQPSSNTIPLKLESPKVRADSERTEASAEFASKSPAMKSAAADPAASAPMPSTIAPPAMPESAPKALAAPLSPSPPPMAAALSGGKVDPPQLILRREPVYPSQASQFRLAGEVEVHFFISPQGTVHNVTVVRGQPLLANAAVAAVSGWRYKPALLNGNAVETEARTVFVFKPK
jgi:TonB family protein